MVRPRPGRTGGTGRPGLPRWPRLPGSGRWRAAFCVAVPVQLVVLYAPQSGGPPPVPGLDKVVHLAVFAAVALTALGSGFGLRPVVAVLVLHAGVSELVQASALPARTGDPVDVVADVAGVLLGVLVGRWLALSVTSGLRRSRQSGPAAAEPGLAPGPEREIMEA